MVFNLKLNFKQNIDQKMRTFKNLKEISKKAVATFLQPYCCILLAKYSLAKNPGVLEKKKLELEKFREKSGISNMS